MSGQLWEVVGGGDKGGIVVRQGKDVTSALQAERLATSSLVRELALEGERLSYELVEGKGPARGWVSVRLQGSKDLLVRSQRSAPADQVWKVVGGADKGGILVRQGKDVASAAEADRLSTGALVRELELDGARLHYKRLSGTGPSEGWVSVTLENGKVLMEKSQEEASPEKPLPPELAEVGRTVHPHAKPPEALPQELAPTLGNYTQMPDINASHPGAHFGEVFPHTPDQLREAGAEWLTKAFHKAGTLPPDNKVARVVSQRDFAGGGAALKVILTLEYETPSPDLHTELFVKLPLAPDHKNRLLNLQLALEGREIFFNRFYTKCMPFKTAKYYFGDLSMTTTNWILITEKVDFADNSKRGEELGPGEVEPVVRKGLDFCLPHALDKYVALYRRAAMLTAWAHAGKLGSQLPELYPVKKDGFMIGFPVMAKAIDECWPSLEDFMLSRAPQLFPPDIANPGYAAQLKKECAEIGPVLGKVNKYVLAGEDLWAFIHPNLHIDNAFFFRDAEGRQDTGLLDWGGAGKGFILSQFISGGGALSLAGAEMRVAYTEALVRCYFETLAEFGGPRLDPGEMSLRVALMDIAYIIGSIRLIGTDRQGDVYEYLPKERYADVRGLDDPVFAEDTVEALMLRSVVMMLVEGIKTWKGRNYYQMFSSWRAANPK